MVFGKVVTIIVSAPILLDCKDFVFNLLFRPVVFHVLCFRLFLPDGGV